MIRWKGIGLRLHPLFVLIMLASIATGRFVELITLFCIVLWHEIGHLIAALRFGWSVRELKLLPFGGVMEVDEAGAIPVREEIAVAIAGPCHNLLLAILAFLMGQAGWLDDGWVNGFVHANLIIVLFNLLPILPLDGGKILQAWISLHIPYHRTLLWTAKISLACSGLMIIVSFYPLWNGGLLHLNLLAVGLFLAASNWTYLRNIPYVFLRFLVHRNERSGKQTLEGTLSRPIVIDDSSPLLGIIQLLMKEQYHLVYVMKKGHISRVVTEKTIIDGFLGR